MVMGILLFASLAWAACSAGGSNEGPPEDTTPPEAPSGLAATSSDAEVGVEWEPSEAADLDGYNLYRDTTSISSLGERMPVNGSTLVAETALADTDVDNGTTYYYRVTAVDENGNESGGSSEVTATPFPTPPNRP